MQAPRRLQLRRGNTAAVSTYLGAPGELIVNTDTNTLIVHDGSTVGGVSATVNTAAITSNISALQSNVATLTANAGAQAGSIATLTSNAAVQAGLIADLTANAGAQAGAIVTANTAMKGYVDAAVAGIVIPEVYGNANVAAYLTTNQYATQTYVNTANTAMKGYVDGQISSVNSAWQANAGAQAGSLATLTANAGSQAGSIATLTSNAAVQAGLIATLQSDITTLTANAGAQAGSIATLTSNAATQAGLISDLQSNAATQAGLLASLNFYNDSNVATYLGNHTAKTFGGNVSIQGNLFVNGNISYVNTNSYVVSDNIVQFADNNPNDSLDLGFVAHRTVGGTLQHTGLIRDASDGRWKLFSNVVPQVGSTVDFTNAVYDELVLGNISSPTITNITGNLSAVSGSLATLTANAGVQAGLIADLQSNAAVQAGLLAGLEANAATQSGQIVTANTAMKGYVDAQIATVTGTYSNSNVGSYLTTYTGNIGNVLTTANVVTTQYFIGNGALLTGIVAGGGGGTTYSNTNVAAYLTTANITTTGNITAAWLSGNISITGNVVGTSPNVTIQAGSYSSTFNNQGNVILPNVAVTGNVISGGYFLGNGALLTGIVAGGGTTYSNSNVASYLPTYSGNIGGNITIGGALTVGSVNSDPFTSSDALYVAGGLTTVANISSGGRLVACSFAISTSINSGAIQTNGGIGAWGNVYAGENVVAAGNVSATYFIGNGALLTGIVASGTTYSNTNVAAYLTTYSGNIGNVTTTANITTSQFFIGNGSRITGISGYSNANVTSYLPTHSGNVGVNNIIGTTPNVTLQANSYSSTFDIYGNVAFGNTTHPVQTFASGNISTAGNVVAYGIAGITMPNRPAFRVNGVNPGNQSTADVNLKGSAISTVYNQGNYFDATTGKFTAPVAGIYEVLLNARVNSSYNSLAQIVVLKNGLNSGGNVIAFWETTSNAAGATHFGVSGTVVLAAGDYLSANILSGNVTFDQNDNWCVTYLG